MHILITYFFLLAREFRTSLRAHQIVNLRIPKGSSYKQDDSFWISGLAEARANRECAKDSDDEFEQPDGQEEFVAPEQFSTTHVMGWVLMKDICEFSHCEVCQKHFLTDGPTDESHALIGEKEYVKGENHLTYPSEMARTMFTKCEELFQKNQENLVLKPKVVTKLAKQALQYVQTAMPHMPTCHLHSIIRRYLNIRLHRWTSLKSSHLLKKTKSSENASKSAKGHSLTKTNQSAEAKAAKAAEKEAAKAFKAAEKEAAKVAKAAEKEAAKAKAAEDKAAKKEAAKAKAAEARAAKKAANAARLAKVKAAKPI